MPYDPAWPEMAAKSVAGLQVLGSTLVAAHHIGSTSVPGLAAKPIIDLMPVIANLFELDRKRALVESLGYSWHGELGITERRYCTPPAVAHGPCLPFSREGYKGNIRDSRERRHHETH
jgi:GrpB-like predicted nucleotidyltransferase (UPF0157 family)